jgi:anti-anti-sigma factor
MDKNIVKNGETVVISIAGQLISSDRIEFDSVLADVFTTDVKAVEVELSKLAYIDSVGLGMLISLRDEAEKNGATVELVGPQRNVQTLLNMVRFDILFTIR